jgi:hypothetical protein
MDTLLLNVKDLAVNRIAPVHPVDPDFSHIYICANQFLKAWAQAIPQEKLALIGPRLQTIKSVLEEHPFEILFIWNQPPIEPELCIQYRDKKTTTPLLNVSLTPHLLLFKDLQHNYKEIAFPSTWSA